MSKAQGQFTIIDYNDALTLTGYIGSNLAKTQMYNPDNGSYTPDWKIMRCDSDSGKKLIKSMVLRTADRQGMC